MGATGGEEEKDEDDDDFELFGSDGDDDDDDNADEVSDVQQLLLEGMYWRRTNQLLLSLHVKDEATQKLREKRLEEYAAKKAKSKYHN